MRQLLLEGTLLW